MPKNSIRTIIAFSVIALVLAGAAVGGAFLVKSRNSSFASKPSQVAQTDTTKQPTDQKTDTAKTEDQNKTDDTSSQKQQDQPSAPAQTETPAPSTQPSAATNDKKSDEASNKSATTLPATSAMSPADFAPTIALMALAGFFGSKLLRARADYRRYIGL